MTLWTPDTDNCQVEIADNGPDKGKPVRFIRASAVHATPEAVMAENQKKNAVVAEINKALGNDARGEPLGFSWAINSDRSIEITLDDKAMKQSVAKSIAGFNNVTVR